MLTLIRLCLGTVARVFCTRRRLLLENLVLRQQLAVFKRRRPRPRLDILDKLFWVAARRIWSDWKNSLIVVTPETVVGWHRAGFRLYWRLISRPRQRLGRKRLPREARDLIFRMVAENPTWGAPRIHGELLTYIRSNGETLRGVIALCESDQLRFSELAHRCAHHSLQPAK
jgi:putative transposase